MSCTYEYNGEQLTREQIQQKFSGKNFASPVYASVPTTPYKKLADFKGQLADVTRKKLARVNRDLSGNNTVSERRELLKMKDYLETKLNGDVKKGIKGLINEVADLMSNQLTDSIGFYVEQDLNRLDVLSRSNNPNDIKEAQSIIDFYDDAGSFIQGIENPFFEESEIFKVVGGKITPTIILPEATLKQYKDWRDKAMSYQSTINVQEKEAVENLVNSDPGSVAQKGKQTYEKLIHEESGLQDIDVISAQLLDVTQTFTGKSSLISQAMHNHISNTIEIKEKFARQVQTELDGMHDKIERELSTIEGGKYKLSSLGILGINGASYKLFMQKTRTGRETGKLISPYNEVYHDMIKLATDNFFTDLRNTANITDYQQRQEAISKAYNKLFNKKRATSVIFDVTKIPEIASDPAFASFSSKFVNDSSHKQEIISMIGQKQYDYYVAEQKRLLINYMAERENLLAEAISTAGVNDYNSLSDKDKFIFNLKDSSISPFVAVDSFYEPFSLMMGYDEIHNSGKYSSYIPRKYGVNFTIADNKIIATNTTIETGFYNKEFEIVQNNPVLSEFYDTAKRVVDTLRDNLPPEIQRKMAVGSIPLHAKTVSEILLDTRGGFLSKIVPAFKKMLENFKLSWGIVKEGDLSDAILDRKTKKPNYKINTSFLEANLTDINRMVRLEEIKFMQAAGISEIRNSTVIDINLLQPNAVALVSQYVGVDITAQEIRAGNLGKITSVTGQFIPIKKIIKEFATHQIVQSQSFDLPKLLKLYSSLTMAYSAREEILPVLEIAKKHSDSIKAPMLNNTGKQKTNKFTRKDQLSGFRNNHIMRQEDWFNRVVLNNYDGDRSKKVIPGELYSAEEKKLIKTIDELIANEKDDAKKEELNNMKKGLGKIVTSTSIVDRILKHIRFLGLGWNIPSSMMNYMEGFTSNMIQASSNEFYDGKHIYYAYKVTRWSRLKWFTGMIKPYEADLAKKNSTLMSRFNVLMDSKNEIQKSSTKTNFSALEKLNPYYINSSVEFVNQSPIMISMLLTEKIKDRNGVESSVWDAMDADGNLTTEFRTDENVNNWEGLTGEQYLKFKNKMSEAIVKAHGNYSDLRGMKAKSTLAGKIILTFKTWVSSQLYSRFATEQFNAKSQSIQKGRVRSLTTGSGALYGAVVGTVVLGPVGAALGGVIGGGVGMSTYGVKADATILKQLAETAKELVKRMAGMPVNIVAGKRIIDTSGGFEKWKNNTSFKEVDLKNLRATLTEMALILNTFIMYLAIKGIFNGDDEDKEKKMVGNFLINKTTQLLDQATVYTKPNAFLKNMLGDIALLKWITNIGKLGDSITDYLNGDDIAQAGDYRGESNLWRNVKTPFMPGIIRNPLSLGFESQSRRVFQDNPWSEYYKSADEQEKEDITRTRAEYKKEIEDNYPNEEQLKKVIDSRYPTQGQLRRKEMSREDYEKEYGGSFELPVAVPKEVPEEE